MTRQDAVVLITAALLSNPKRYYKYITYEMTQNGTYEMTQNGMSQNEAAEKNVHEAAQLVVDEIEVREGQFPTVEGKQTQAYRREEKEPPF